MLRGKGGLRARVFAVKPDHNGKQTEECIIFRVAFNGVCLHKTIPQDVYLLSIELVRVCEI